MHVCKYKVWGPSGCISMTGNKHQPSELRTHQSFSSLGQMMVFHKQKYEQNMSKLVLASRKSSKQFLIEIFTYSWIMTIFFEGTVSLYLAPAVSTPHTRRLHSLQRVSQHPPNWQQTPGTGSDIQYSGCKPINTKPRSLEWKLEWFRSSSRAFYFSLTNGIQIHHDYICIDISGCFSRKMVTLYRSKICRTHPCTLLNPNRCLIWLNSAATTAVSAENTKDFSISNRGVSLIRELIFQFRAT